MPRKKAVVRSKFISFDIPSDVEGLKTYIDPNTIIAIEFQGINKTRLHLMGGGSVDVLGIVSQVYSHILSTMGIVEGNESL